MTTVDTLVAQNPNNCFSYNLYQSIPADVDYIIIKYGINDENHLAAGNITIGTITDSDTHTFYGAWNTVLSWLISNRPGAKIGIIVSNDIANSGILDAVEAVARKYGIPTLNEARDTKLPYWYRQFPRTEVDSSIRNARNDYYKMNASNSHPNDACQEFESTFVEAWIKSL